MAFVLADGNGAAGIVLASEEYSGVKKAAAWLGNDISLVTGKTAQVEADGRQGINYKNRIIAGTIGHSSVLDEAAESLGFDLSPIKGKREVYGIFVSDDTVIIAGSEKRGTIYGLLHISELIGVTPMIFFGDTNPVKYNNIYIESGAPIDGFTVKDKTKINTDGEADVRNHVGKCADDLYIAASGISKEPSVKYRGFFINDEWPGFGNWCNRHFGGFTAECYEKIFEYLLRLKGNYMWPAMWSSIFSIDGPGLKSAELADELGVVMGTSHHEPCCRAGEEFQKLKLTHPEYGVDWSFVKNRDGVTRFWEDGLKRNGGLENVITVGMRGEADSKLFADATLEDNINVLKNVINCQKELIAKNSQGDQPTMLAVYKEVEEYYKGDSVTPGLKDWDGLDGVTLMLCDDNFGNLRQMMDDDKRSHNGGYGMYYHFDYHGGPVSYEWINSSYLPKIWEQMTTAYDFGIRDIWIVNVGDLKNQELPLSYFLDLAYDFEKYGTDAKDNYIDYQKEWVRKQFRGLEPEAIEFIEEITDGYTRLNNLVKPEVLSENTYSLEHFNEAGRILNLAAELEKKAEFLAESIDRDYYETYISLVGYQALATFNLVKMQIFARMNKKYAMQGRMTANRYARLVKECINRDRELTGTFHSFASEKWYGMGLSKHIGFRAWNDEGCRLPAYVYVEPETENEVIVADDDSDYYSGGGAWTRRPVRLTGFDYRGEGSFSIATAGKNPVTYTIECDDRDIIFCGEDNKYTLSGIADSENDVQVIVRAADNAKIGRHEFTVKTDAGSVKVFFEIGEHTLRKSTFKDGVNTLREKITSVPAEHFYQLKKGGDGEFRVLKNFGRLLPSEEGSALKAYPQDVCFKSAPWAEYLIDAYEEGTYRMIVYTAPSNPSSEQNRIPFMLKVNDAPEVLVNTIPEKYVGGENSCGDWCVSVLENIRKTEYELKLHKGRNSIIFEPVSPGFVLEKFELIKDGVKVPYSRLGCV